MKTEIYCKSKVYLWSIVLVVSLLSNVVVYWYINGKLSYLEFIQISVSVVIISVYFYRVNRPIFILDNEKIIDKYPFGKTIELNKLEQIKYFAGDYTLITSDQSLIIKTDMLREEDKERLELVLKSWQQKLLNGLH